jgi:hypothetical protein
MTLRTARMTLLVAVVLLTPYFAAGAAPTPSSAPTPPAPAAPSPQPPRDNPDPWAKLCDPGMKWELEPLAGGKRTKKTGHEWPIVRIESANPREVAGVKVCRLKWFLVEEGKKPISFASRGIEEHLRQGDERQPSWYEVQYALDEARQIAITPKGLVIVQREGNADTSDSKLGGQLTDLLSKDFVRFPGRGASAKQQAKLDKTGHHFRRWGFTAGEHQIACYGHKDEKCDAEDTTCHQAACFVRGLGLVALYFGTGSAKFPADFTFYSLVGFPEFASWRPAPSATGK